MKRLAIALAAAAVVGTAVPASAQGLYVGVGSGYYGGYYGAGGGEWGVGFGWGGPAYASYGWGPGYAYGGGPGYWGGPTYAYAWDNPGYTVTYRRPRARVYAYESVPRRYRRVVRDSAYGAYAYSGPGYRYGGFAGPGYRDWGWGW
jgi:hypothetical protein